MDTTNTQQMSIDNLNDSQILELNKRYRPLGAKARIAKLYEDFDHNSIMVTSSFAATSALLLKVVSDINPKQKVHFIDTGFHFKETLEYRDSLIDLFHLNVENVKAEKWKHDFTIKDETWKKDPNLCCSINKVEPLDSVKDKHKIWISGLMKWQSDHRATLDVFEKRGNVLKFYPLLDVTKEERSAFIEEHSLPFHPLLSKGYHSIGCVHCTAPGEGRSGRWNNNPKTECGLHL